MIEISNKKIKDRVSVTVPGSKSYTHRTLIAAALSNGRCIVENALRSEDTLLTLDALKKMGTKVEDDGNRFVISGLNGVLSPCETPIYLANSGTSMRLLTGVAALGQGKYIFNGTERMHERPVEDLLVSLRQLGIGARSINNDGCPPVEISCSPIEKKEVSIHCSTSSQYLSSLMLMAPCTVLGLDIRVSGGPVSKPYIDLTVNILRQFGIQLEREGYDRFQIPGSQEYRSGTYAVESDCSQAGYFWAAAAVTGSRIKVRGIAEDTAQGDMRLVEVLESMGCRVDLEPDGISVTGATLEGVTVDMGDMPDVVPTLAVVAAFARGKTIIKNVAHLRVKECDRLAAVSSELSKMGIRTQCGENELVVEGGRPHGALIHTWDDHRIAMSFAIAGLMVPGIIIEDENCVGKSFPRFWEVMGSLYVREDS